MPIRGDRVVRRTSPAPSVTLYPRRLRVVGLVLIWALFVAACVYLAGEAVEDGSYQDIALWIFLTIPCVLLFVVTLRMLFSGRPVLVVDERGITNGAPFGTRFLPWTHITSVSVTSMGIGRTWIEVRVRDPKTALANAGLEARLGYRFAGGGMYISTATLPLSIDAVLEEIAALAPEGVRVDVGRHRRPEP